MNSIEAAASYLGEDVSLMTAPAMYSKSMNDVYIQFFSQFFTNKDKKILQDKNIEPTEKEKALWAAYGIFNGLDPVDGGESVDTFTKFVSRFIDENGGWEYFSEG